MSPVSSQAAKVAIERGSGGGADMAALVLTCEGGGHATDFRGHPRSAGLPCAGLPVGDDGRPHYAEGGYITFRANPHRKPSRVAIPHGAPPPLAPLFVACPFWQ